MVRFGKGNAPEYKKHHSSVVRALTDIVNVGRSVRVLSRKRVAVFAFASLTRRNETVGRVAEFSSRARSAPAPRLARVALAVRDAHYGERPATGHRRTTVPGASFVG